MHIRYRRIMRLEMPRKDFKLTRSRLGGLCGGIITLTVSGILYDTWACNTTRLLDVPRLDRGKYGVKGALRKSPWGRARSSPPRQLLITQLLLVDPIPFISQNYHKMGENKTYIFCCLLHATNPTAIEQHPCLISFSKGTSPCV